jgi:hypothetical protein
MDNIKHFPLVRDIVSCYQLPVCSSYRGPSPSTGTAR